MLDFVVWDAITWVIDVRGGWWHRGSEFEFEIAIKRYMKRAQVIILGDKECVSKESVLTYLRMKGLG